MVKLSALIATTALVVTLSAASNKTIGAQSGAPVPVRKTPPPIAQPAQPLAGPQSPGQRVQAAAPFIQQGQAMVGTGPIRTVMSGPQVALSKDGNTAVVGYVGVNGVWIYTRSGASWVQQGPILSGTGEVMPAQQQQAGGFAWQGQSVALSADGNTFVVGGSEDNAGVGATWVFIRNGSGWTQQAKLVGSGVGPDAPQQGWSVALSADGNTALVGGIGTAPRELHGSSPEREASGRNRQSSLTMMLLNSTNRACWWRFLQMEIPR